MLRLLVKATVFLIVVTVSFAIYIKRWPENFTMGSQGILHAQMDYLADPSNRGDKLHMLVLGDSTMAAAIAPYRFKDMRCLATPAATAIDVYYQLEKFLEHHAPPSSILVGSFNHVGRNEQLFWQLYVNGGFYDRDDVAAIARVCEETGDWPVVESDAVWPAGRFWGRYWSFALGFFPPYVDEIQQHLYYGDLRRRTNQQMRESLSKHHGLLSLAADLGDVARERKREKVLNLASSDFLQTEYRKSPTLEHYVRELLALAGRTKTPVCWVFPPVAEQVMSDVARKYLDDYKAHISSLVDPASNGATVDVRFDVANGDYFWDELHLSDLGARVYSDALETEWLRIVRESLEKH